jgi:DNA-binding NtrC family response regulator
LDHPWPGNVRELKNVITRTVLLCAGGVIRPHDIQLEAVGGQSTTLPPSLPAPPVSSTDAAFPPTVRADAVTMPPPRIGAGEIPEDERHRILDALEKSAGNQTRAARLLGMARRTLLKRLDALGVPRPRKRADEDD